MASKYPPTKNSAYVFRCVLFAQSDNQIKSNPTLASGDWKVSIDGGAFANLATLPDVDPDGSVQVKVSLSATEMNGDEIMVTAIDAAGAEWHSASWVIYTSGQTFDTMDALIDTLIARLTATRAGYLDNLSGGAAALEATAQAILDDTAEIGAAGAGLTALGDSRLANLDATVGSRLATAGYTAPPTAAANADAVWDEATAGHAGAGSTGAAIIAAGNAGDPWATELPGAYTGDQAGAIVGSYDAAALGAEVWTYSPRTLTSTAAQIAAAVSGSDLSIHRGDTFSASITGLGDIQSRTALYWTVKESVNQADTRAAVQVEETDGLLILKGATAATAGDGDITVTNAATGAITLTLAAAATAELTPGVYYYDVQQVTGGGVETLTAARLTVVADVTRAVA